MSIKNEELNKVKNNGSLKKNGKSKLDLPEIFVKDINDSNIITKGSPKKDVVSLTKIDIPDIENVEDVKLEDFIYKVRQMFNKKMRFVTATCLDERENYQVYYHFDKNLKMSHLKLTVNKEQEVPSITEIYFAAFLIENEMKELFGLKVKDIAIDYKGKLFLCNESLKYPMLKSVKG